MRILYVDIDSLRPDHLSCYGYHRPTSPVIDRIAAQGIRFSNYFASDSPCVPSRAACFSARPGIQNGVVAHENTPIASQLRYTTQDRAGYAPMWMHHLVKAGINTVSFSSFANRHLAGWFHFGFKQFNLVSLKNGNEDAVEINEIALPWFKEHASEDNWFVHLNYWDPHTFYTEPLEYMHKMAAHPAPAWPDEATIQQQQSLTGIRTPSFLWTDQEHDQGKSRFATMPDHIANYQDFTHLINGYDGAINYVDQQLGRVLAELETQGVLDETAIIISADHAEAFGELGQYMEHGSVSPAVNRIPLIISWPGLTDKHRNTEVDALLTNVDLAPTVSAALGLPIPEGWSGLNFFPLLQGETLTNPRSELFIGHGLHTRQRAVYDGRWLYIRTYHPSLYQYEPEMLFDLDSDPHQTQNLTQQHPVRTQTMAQQLQNWETAQLALTGLSDPMRDVQPISPNSLSTLDDHLTQLHSLGREDDANQLLTRWHRIPSDYAPQT